MHSKEEVNVVVVLFSSTQLVCIRVFSNVPNFSSTINALFFHHYIYFNFPVIYSNNLVMSCMLCLCWDEIGSPNPSTYNCYIGSCLLLCAPGMLSMAIAISIPCFFWGVCVECARFICRNDLFSCDSNEPCCLLEA